MWKAFFASEIYFRNLPAKMRDLSLITFPTKSNLWKAARTTIEYGRHSKLVQRADRGPLVFIGRKPKQVYSYYSLGHAPKKVPLELQPEVVIQGPLEPVLASLGVRPKRAFQPLSLLAF